jgi:serine/threonine-protein kinase RsbW
MPNPQGMVVITVPARAEFLHVVRTVVGSVAARHDLTIDAIEDLRIAVDEACAQLLARRAQAQTLRVDYAVDNAALQVRVSIPDATSDEPLPRDTFAWQILRALTDDLNEGRDASGRHLSFRKVGGRH